jgi:ubiquinone/menaquinone biosynthesis C-methylase UbiE
MDKIFRHLIFRNKHVCPRWLCFTFDNIFRELLHDPYKILRPYIKEGDTVLDVGPGIGYFTIPMAHLVGNRGRVIVADVQNKMLLAIKERAKRAGVLPRVNLHLASADSLGVKTKVDFILAFWMVHEVLDKEQFFSEAHFLLKKNGKFLMVEPKFHVSRKKFVRTLDYARKAGFTIKNSPYVSLSRAALFINKTKK